MGTSPLAGKRVVSTRAAEQSEPLATLLQSLGAEVILLPLIQIEPPLDCAPLDEALRNIGSFDWMILTSQNAVNSIRERVATVGTDLGGLSKIVKIATVSDITASAASAVGLRVSYVGRGGAASDLLAELTGELRGKHVLLPRGDRADSGLTAQLHEAGARVTEVIAYRTVEADLSEAENLAAASRADAILFFSPSAVTAFRKIARIGRFDSAPDSVAIGAIGRITETALREEGMPCDFVATQPSTDQIVAALVRYFEQRPVRTARVSATPGALSS